MATLNNPDEAQALNNQVDTPVEPQYKRYMVVKTTCKLYEVYADSRQEALDMVKFNLSHGLAGLPNQKGFNTLLGGPKLEDFKVTKELEKR